MDYVSGNKKINEFLRQNQLNSTGPYEVLEWIPYDKFKNITYLAEGGFGTVHKALWVDGYIRYFDVKDNKWQRQQNSEVPPLVKELIERCLKEDPSIRPTANELNNTFLRWYRSSNKNDNAEFLSNAKKQMSTIVYISNQKQKLQHIYLQVKV
ncbi:13764_t:CDS:2 [Funneliformis caledonium]|uniref:13764_t:CDS:1 n=1 Tax=Funneliformis caledonium TaxID=1117310 RepID=A0A9N8V9R7_9GLOM|nr:13764_t:CDS:2 [Funneliformis caledonium]